jgi:hypothetical protein
MRSKLTDKEIQRQRGEHSNVVATEAGEQEATRSRLVDGGDFGVER